MIAPLLAPVLAMVLNGPVYVFDVDQLIGSSAPPSQCVTRCGLEAPVSGKVCEALQNYETATLIAFEYRKVWTMHDACAALKGWGITHAEHADAHGLFPDDDFPRGVWGLTYQDHRIVLGSFDWPNSALSHEMAHVISIVLEQNSTHDRWTQRGICRAVNDVQNHLRCVYGEPACSAWRP